jgi:predicted NAD/FAD-dependent oxidoreductase
MERPRIAIIGAGISGLACGQALLRAGASVLVFEKSRSLGGRLATRRWEDHVVDHGAPWFTLPVGLELDGICQEAGHLPPPLAVVPAPEWDAASAQAVVETEGACYYLPAGNNRLAKWLAPEVIPRLETTVEALRPLPEDRWEVAGETFEAVVLTAPWPQSRRLLAPWLPESEAFAEPAYGRTLTAFFEYGGDPSGPAAAWSGIRHGPDRDDTGLWRSICENQKPDRIRPGCTVIVAHATPAFSDLHFETERALWSARLEQAVRAAWQLSAPPRAIFTHRWGFSTTGAPFQVQPILPAGLYLAGDAVSGSSVGAVWKSGLTVAQKVLAECGTP